MTQTSVHNSNESTDFIVFIVNYYTMASVGEKVCKVHGSREICVSSHVTKLRIALAFVVIRLKPADRTVKDFVTHLQTFHQDKVNSTRYAALFQIAFQPFK